jgi:hypothetical protein
MGCEINQGFYMVNNKIFALQKERSLATVKTVAKSAIYRG